jgi:shikimate kinase
MTRVLLTGMSGSGKSTVISGLAARGYRAVDADEDGLSELVRVPETEPTGPGPGLDWVWREDRIHELLDSDEPGGLFLGGCAPNQGRFYSRFDHIVLLTAPPAVLARRLATRTTNPFGKRPDERARALGLIELIEPRLRRAADLEVDTTLPLDETIDLVLRHVGAI